MLTQPVYNAHGGIGNLAVHKHVSITENLVPST